MKTVTVETLAEAVAPEGCTLYGCETDPCTCRSIAQRIYDALPATPLADDVQAAVERLAHDIDNGIQGSVDRRHSDRGTIITALHAATAQCERWKQYTVGLEKSIIEALLERNQAKHLVIASAVKALEDLKAHDIPLSWLDPRLIIRLREFLHGEEATDAKT